METQISQNKYLDEFLSAKQMESLNFFQEHLEEWVNNPLHKYKYVIIYDSKLSGIFDTFDAALVDAVAKYPRDAFIIQQVVSEDEVVNFIYSAVC